MTSASSTRSILDSCREWIQSRRLTLGAAAIIAVAATIAFHNSFSGPFVFDDLPSIPNNPFIRHLWPFWEVVYPSHQDMATINGRPLIKLSFALNYALGGTAVWSYHVVNLLIHILSGLTLLGVVRRTLLQPVLRDRFGSAALPLALVIALLWTVHPLQTESVTYTTQRCESLMGLFYLLTLYTFIRGTESGGDARWLSLSVVTCLLGSASKEAMISAPLIILLYDRTFVVGTFRKALRERKTYYMGLVCSWMFLIWLMVRAGAGNHSVGYIPGLPPSVYMLNEFHAVAIYLRLAVWPYPQVLDYGPPEISNLGQVGFSAPVILLLLAGTLFALRRTPTPAHPWPALGFLGCWFFLILAPTSSFIPVKDVMAEHRMYLSLAAIIAVAVMGVYAWLGWRGMAIFLLVAPIYITLTILRNNDYRSEVAIWSDTVAKRPLNERAHINLAYALASEGRTTEALEQDEEAVRMDPQDSYAHGNLGAVMVQLGRNSEAMEQYKEALQIDPGNGPAHTNRGVLLEQMGQTSEAMAELDEALKYNRRDAVAHNNLGVAFASLGQLPEAVQHYQAAIEINPDYAEAHGNLGGALGQQGNFSGAVEQYQEVLRITPRDPEAHYNLGVALTGLGRIPEAMDQYEEALKINPHYTHALNNLAWLRAENAPAKN